MAGFLLYKKETGIDRNKLKATFQQNGYSEGKFLDFGNWELFLLKKKMYQIQNWQVIGDSTIACCGTFCYRGLFYEKSLNQILIDLNSDQLDLSEFYGTFLVLILSPKSLVILRDGAEIFKIYKHTARPIYSSSFYVLTKLLEKNLELDYMPCLELLNTGSIIGSDTIVKDIQLHRLSDTIPGFATLIGEPKSHRSPLTFRDAVQQQVEITQDYISTLCDSWNKHTKAASVDVGLTGGLDSRYLAGLLLNKDYKTVFHTHWRKRQCEDKDFKHAVGLANHYSIPISKEIVAYPIEMSNDQLRENYDAAYKFCDAIIRPGCYWDEPYSTSEYRERVHPAPYLRLLGFGGEQYRNMERLPIRSTLGLEAWVKWEMIYRFVGANLEREMRRKLVQFVAQKLSTCISQNKLNLFSFKEYNRNVVSVSYRSIQTNIENKNGFCVSPYLDIQLSDPSFLAIPFLGNSFKFHLEMLKLVSPDIAKYPNSYGFDFYRGEPLKLRVGASLWQSLPSAIKYPMHSAFRPYHRSNYIDRLSVTHEFISDLESRLQNYLPGLDYKKYRKVSSRSKMALNLAYFLVDNEMI